MEENNKKIVVLGAVAPGDIHKVYINSFKSKIVMFDEIQPSVLENKVPTYKTRTDTVPWKEKKLRRNKKKSQR